MLAGGSKPSEPASPLERGAGNQFQGAGSTELGQQVRRGIQQASSETAAAPMNALPVPSIVPAESNANALQLHEPGI